jgi:hypothetical protein
MTTAEACPSSSMLERTIDRCRALAVQGMYLSTFSLAAWLKWSEGVPQWFEVQFHGSWLARLPGGPDGVFWMLAALETIAAIGFLLSLVSGEAFRPRRPILSISLVFSLFIFVILAYGSRLTGKMDIAGWDFLYFAGTLLALTCERPVMRGTESP